MPDAYNFSMGLNRGSGVSYKDIPQLGADETFTSFAGLKSLEYIHTQFYQQKNSRDAVLDTKNACFSDLYATVDGLVKKLYNLFVSVQSQTSKLKTFEETMVQLDDVFTNSASGENEQANREVAGEIRKMQQVQMDQIFEMQNEIAHLKSLKDIPFELIKILRRANSKDRMGMGSMAELDKVDEERTAMQVSGSRKSMHRSRSRKQTKPPSDKNSKAAKHLGMEINSALDRMQELEAQNELLILENQKTKDEIADQESKVKNLKKDIEEFEDKLKKADREQADQESIIKKKKNLIEEQEADIEKHATKAKKLAQLNEELRQLFEEEREAMGDETEKLHFEIEQIHHQHERKAQMLKSKLFLLVSAFSMGRDLKLERERASMDDMFKELQHIAHTMPKKYMSAAQS